MFEKLKSRAQTLKRETRTLVIVLHDPRTPWYAKALIGFVLAYALSPIDLIPDFIPVLGLMDDAIIVPAGITFALKMIPADIINDARKIATQENLRFPALGIIGMIVIILIWILVAVWLIWRLYPLLSKIK